MKTNDRLRDTVAELLETGEQINAVVSLLNNPSGQNSTVHDAARNKRKTKWRYIEANGLDPESGWQHLASDTICAVTSSRVVFLNRKVSALRPTPKSIAHATPLVGSRLGWVDVKLTGVNYRLVHFDLADGTFTVQYVQLQGSFFRKRPPGEVDLLIQAFGDAAREVQVPPHS